MCAPYLGGNPGLDFLRHAADDGLVVPAGSLHLEPGMALAGSGGLLWRGAASAAAHARRKIGRRRGEGSVLYICELTTTPKSQQLLFSRGLHITYIVHRTDASPRPKFEARLGTPQEEERQRRKRPASERQKSCRYCRYKSNGQNRVHPEVSRPKPGTL